MTILYGKIYKMNLTLQLHLTNEWIDVATLKFLDPQNSVLSYDIDYACENLGCYDNRALSCRFPVG